MSRGRFSDITKEQAALIRKRYFEGVFLKDIAAEVGITLSMVRRFIEREDLIQQKPKKPDYRWPQDLIDTWSLLNQRYGTRIEKPQWKKNIEQRFERVE